MDVDVCVWVCVQVLVPVYVYACVCMHVVSLSHMYVSKLPAEGEGGYVMEGGCAKPGCCALCGTEARRASDTTGRGHLLFGVAVFYVRPWVLTGGSQACRSGS